MRFQNLLVQNKSLLWKWGSKINLYKKIYSRGFIIPNSIPVIFTSVINMTTCCRLVWKNKICTNQIAIRLIPNQIGQCFHMSAILHWPVVWADLLKFSQQLFWDDIHFGSSLEKKYVVIKSNSRSDFQCFNPKYQFNPHKKCTFWYFWNNH